MFLPFNSREDVDFFSHIEMHLRQENPPLLGRDHLAYRSYYFPVKDVIDGDLCEQFAQVGSLCDSQHSMTSFVFQSITHGLVPLVRIGHCLKLLKQSQYKHNNFTATL